MGKVNFGMKKHASTKSKTSGGNFYDGEVPTKGPYIGLLKRLELVYNSSDDHMLRGLLEIDEPKKSKSSKYNGYGVWFNQNVTDVGAPYLNAFLEALAGDDPGKQKSIKNAFWGPGPTIAGKSDEGHVLKIGSLKIGSPEGKLHVAFNGRRKKYDDEYKLIVGSWLIMEGSDDEEDDDEGEEDYAAEDYEAEEADEGEDEGEEEDEEVVAPKKKGKKAKRPEPEDDEEDEEEEERPKPKKKKGKRGAELF